MTLANILKILGLIAALATAGASVLQAINPEIAVWVGAIASAIFAFTTKIGGGETVTSKETEITQVTEVSAEK
jgi:hypothetical protein